MARVSAGASPLLGKAACRTPRRRRPWPRKNFPVRLGKDELYAATTYTIAMVFLVQHDPIAAHRALGAATRTSHSLGCRGCSEDDARAHGSASGERRAHRDPRLWELLAAPPPGAAREEPPDRGAGSAPGEVRGAFQAGQGASRARGWVPRCGCRQGGGGFGDERPARFVSGCAPVVGSIKQCEVQKCGSW